MKNGSTRRCSRSSFRRHLESLESRLTPTTFTVSTLADSGAGSLRAAITSVNQDKTGDVINFSVAGVIQLTSDALPAITNSVTIDGTSAPGFVSAPVVEIDNHGFAGLTVQGVGFSLSSLSIVNANGPGLTLETVGILMTGNYIGLALDGTIAANTGVGVLVNSAQGDIGGTAAADRNVISGNGAGGIQLNNVQGVNVLGNFIGTDSTGQAAAANQGNGITLSGGFNNIGGQAAGAGNTIAFNSQYGVVVNSGGENAINQNSIFKNGTGGILLGDGANSNQPAPILTAAFQPTPTTIEVSGNLLGQVNPSLEDRNFTVEIFATPAGSPGSQGQIFLGSFIVGMNPAGSSPFVFRTTFTPESGTTFTATATGPRAAFGEDLHETSAFSPAISEGGDAQSVFVSSAYGLLLNRLPDPLAGFWVNLLRAGVAAPTVVLGIEASTEYLTTQVDALYQNYLLRAADPVGQQVWVSFLQRGGTLEQVAASIASSAESFAQTGSNQGFIDDLYGDVLNRIGPSDAESAYWNAVLDAGVSRYDVALAFLTSQEYRTALVQSDYSTFLLRPADPGGLMTWVNYLNAGATDQQTLAGIFGSTEGYGLWS